jgi:hypothetical protein
MSPDQTPAGRDTVTSRAGSQRERRPTSRRRATVASLSPNQVEGGNTSLVVSGVTVIVSPILWSSRQA